MAKVSRSVLIAAPIKEVFDYVASLENRRRWLNSVVSTRVLYLAPEGVGTVFEEVRRVAGRTVRRQDEVVVYYRPYRYAYRTLGPSRWRTYSLHEFAETPEGTLMHYTNEFQVEAGLLGKPLNELVLTQRYRSCHAKTLQNLKRVWSLGYPPPYVGALRQKV